MSWTGRVEQLLYDGERVQRRVAVGSSTVVVTSHRVLAFTPGDGQIYRHVDRPNVRSATLESGGSTRYLFWAIASGGVGLCLLAMTALFSFADLVPDVDTGGADAVGSTGDVVGGALGTVEALLVLVDLGILLGGGLLLAVAAGSVALYSRSRSRHLVIEVRGEDDIELPAASVDDVGAVALELDEAIRPDAAGTRDALAADSEASDEFGADGDRFTAESRRETTVASEGGLADLGGLDGNDGSAGFGAVDRGGDSSEFDAVNWRDENDEFNGTGRRKEGGEFEDIGGDRGSDDRGTGTDRGREESG